MNRRNVSFEDLAGRGSGESSLLTFQNDLHASHMIMKNDILQATTLLADDTPSILLQALWRAIKHKKNRVAK